MFRAVARWILLPLFVVISFIAFLYLVLGPFAEVLANRYMQGLTAKEKVDAINSLRQLILTAFAGLVATVGVIITARTYVANRRGQVTDRYSKSIALLASDKISERVGGVYALEHIMLESPVDHNVIVDVLTAFIRESRSNRELVPPDTRIHPDDIEPPDEYDGPEEMIPADIQAAISVLGRRPNRKETARLDFSNAFLNRANFSGARLDGAIFFNASLGKANFESASLLGVKFNQCAAWNVNFSKTKLNDARFFDTNLYRCDFSDADLSESIFEASRLTANEFAGTRMQNAVLQNVVVSASHAQLFCQTNVLVSSDSWVELANHERCEFDSFAAQFFESIDQDSSS